MSACGSTQQTTARQTTSTVAPTPRVGFSLPPAVNHVILPPLSGAGNERLGSFTPDGTVDLELSCKGAAHSIAIVGISRSSPCDGNPVGIGIPRRGGETAEPRRARRAWNDLGAWPSARRSPTQRCACRHHGGGQQVLRHLRGTRDAPLQDRVSRPGLGASRVLFPKTNASRGDEGNCVGLSYAREADVDVQGDRVQISVDAPRKTRAGRSP